MARGRGGRVTSITVWIVDLTRDDNDARFRDVLGRDELRRAAKFRDPAASARYARAHFALREILGKSLDVDPSVLVFERATCVACGNAHGKPRLAFCDGATHFSLARRADAALVAVAPRAPVGVDLEPLDRAWQMREIRDLLVADGDDLASAALGARSGAEISLLQMWTRKEAALKAVGTGLATPLTSVSVKSSARTPWHDVTGIGDVRVRDIAVAGHVAALAAVGPCRRVAIEEWPR